ncbi:MAG: DUF805 domain-containing protein [Akkermansia sp.]|nr:DUF805 domain-containing protein [Akkermansia sp.]
MLKSLREGFRHYADFRGRSTRAMFWNFVVATHLVIWLCMLPALVEFMKFYHFLLQDVRFVSLFLDSKTLALAYDTSMVECVVKELGEEYFAGGVAELWPVLLGLVLGCVAALAVAVPTLAVTVRRLRDAGKSPWWVLPPVLTMVPLPVVCHLASVLSLVTLVFCCLRSKEELPPLPPEN